MRSASDCNEREVLGMENERDTLSRSTDSALSLLLLHTSNLYK